MKQSVKRFFALLGGGSFISSLCIRTGYDFLYFRTDF